MDKPARPLRILAIVNVPWDARLGAPRVWIELAEQWRSMGHVVEKFSLSDAFPGVRATRVTFALRQLIFIRKAAAFVRQNGHRFDVIDALIGTLPFTKEELGFRGLLVARSVGLYRLYEQFDRSVAKRWPQPTRGKLVGRILYSFTRRQLLRASESSVRKADLVNVPNDEEATCLRNEIGTRQPVIVEPYGLTEERRRTFLETAFAPEVRLAQKRICFIGMWGARKGAHDWARIIARIRSEVPDATFRFLGTMVTPDAVARDLGATDTNGVEFISEYDPDQLPRLLADCAVGAFPSYVEGFGLAVIEQLAAGIPTVAYDTAGPADILKRGLPDCLVQKGDVLGFGARICAFLRMEAEAYREQSRRAVQIAATFSWRDIARSTVDSYRRLLEGSAHPVLFVQPFSLGSAGGGARILRALLEDAPFAWQSICSTPAKPKAWRNELHLRSRLSWGRIEYSRLSALPNATRMFFARNFRHRLKQRALELNASAIHAVAHAGLDFADAHAVARELGLPFFLSVHDDLAYTLAGTSARQRDRLMSTAWRDAAVRFVISDALGKEYSRRYGDRRFHVVTDGLTHLHQPRTPRASSELRIYFMGLFHMGYERNLRALLKGIAVYERQHSGTTVRMRLRCEHIRPQVLAGANHVTVLPFADEAEVQRDIEHADLLYMPIPFGDEHANFARYSLSTKMVTYLGSGVPILYHGPSTSAAFELLNRSAAAIPITTLDAKKIAGALSEATPEKRAAAASNALDLARRDFMLSRQTERFCGAISAHLGPR